MCLDHEMTHPSIPLHTCFLTGSSNPTFFHQTKLRFLDHVFSHYSIPLHNYFHQTKCVFHNHDVYHSWILPHKFAPYLQCLFHDHVFYHPSIPLHNYCLQTKLGIINQLNTAMISSSTRCKSSALSKLAQHISSTPAFSNSPIKSM